MTSTTLKIAALYACKDDEVPEVLWRVQYGDSSLKARAKPSFETELDLKRAVELHLVWANREPTPFVSLFESKRHATNWASYHLGRRRYNDFSLLKIKGSELNSVFRVRDLVQCKLVQTSITEQWYNDEFLALSELPHHSVMRVTDMSETQTVSDPTLSVPTPCPTPTSMSG
eukprot:jgi/Phyca11/130260/e_gw1.92.51.1